MLRYNVLAIVDESFANIVELRLIKMKQNEQPN